MNQILFADEERYKKNTTQIDIKKIIKFFCIFIIVFGIGLTGVGSYNLAKNAPKAEESEVIYPEIDIQKEGDDYIRLIVTQEQGIQDIKYRWNEAKEHTINGNGKTKINELIQLPAGNNILNIVITDITGKQTKDKREYRSNAVTGPDVESPYLDLTVEGNNVRIIAIDETEIAYVTYKWNDDAETTVEVTEEEKKKIEVLVPILKQENMLIVVAYDASGNSKMEKKTYIGKVKPKVTVEADNNVFIIKASDEIGLKAVVYEFNGKKYKLPINAEDYLKEIEYRQELKTGLNRIIVYVANVQDEIVNFAGEYEYKK